MMRSQQAPWAAIRRRIETLFEAGQTAQARRLTLIVDREQTLRFKPVQRKDRLSVSCRAKAPSQKHVSTRL